MVVVKAPVNSELLSWARVEHGLSVDQAARALGVKPDRLESWEHGDAFPTLNQVRNLARLYQRTPASLLIRRTPSNDEHQRPTDFRSFTGETPALSAGLAREVARAKVRRRHLLEVQESEAHDLPFVPDLLRNAEDAAEQVRHHLGLTVETQKGFSGASEALARWMRAVENLGVLVFQMSRVSPEECRGFSIYEPVLPVIVLNGAEGFGARQFTLLHELAHLISRTSAICDVWRGGSIEAGCNAFGAEVLMPRPAVMSLLKRGMDDPISNLASEFSVSKSASAVRLRTLGRISQNQLDAFLLEARNAAIAQREAAKSRERRGGPSPHLLKVRNLGPRFVGAVLDAMHDERISVVEAAQFLESKVQALDELEAEVERRGVAS